MRVGIPKERRAGEARVAASPDMVKKLAGPGLEIAIERGAGEGAIMPDDAFAEVGVRLVAGLEALYGEADVILKVRRPLAPDEDGPDEVAMMKEGAVLIGLLDPLRHRDQARTYAARRLTVFAMELMPRLSRAQSMDALSSQSNLAGYKAVVDAAAAYGRLMPMMMSAAGTIAPARVLVLGAGVAGLQAIATARRLGAIVSAFDVRPAVKEEVESLGATFIEVPNAEGEQAQEASGYAKEMSEDYRRRQTELIHETLTKTDIAITTALIPGKPAPRLITADMVKDMKPGSVIVDLAVEEGGNCEFSEVDQVVRKNGVTIMGHANLPSELAPDASALYARNLLNFLIPMVDRDSGNLAIDWEDEIINGTLLTRDGEIVHPALTSN
ncbi:MAG: Re/Si-specific NAD(P)(+) transhydrogenase subunit alpha [Alphaproteobacteria bacterium]